MFDKSTILFSTVLPEKNLDKAFKAFVANPLVDISLKDAKDLFNEMTNNTKKYLTAYGI